MIKRICYISFFLMTCLQSNSQDIKMGYMQLVWRYGYSYADTTYLLTDVNTNVNRPYILTDWGVKIDTSRLIQTTLTNNSYLKKYYGICTYPGSGNYLIKWQDTYRIADIKNIGLSDNERIKLNTFMTIPFFGLVANTTPVLQNKNITLSLQNDSVIFKPQFYDVEGDSLLYELTPCFAANYRTPNGVSIDKYGNVSFSKDSLGIYAFSTIIKEWRKDDAGSYVNVQSSQLDFTMNITEDVSVAELKSHSFSVYPNPTHSVLNIVDENNQSQHAIIEIKNPLGQVVLLIPFAKEIDISFLSPGMYFLTVQDKYDKQTVKIIKE